MERVSVVYDFFAIVRTANELGLKDLRDECQVENWAPVMVLRYPDRTVIPLFRNVGTAGKFIRRNLPRNEISGLLGLKQEDQRIFIDRGWELDWHSHPRRYTDRKDVEIDVDGVEIETGFDLRASVGRPR